MSLKPSFTATVPGCPRVGATRNMTAGESLLRGMRAACTQTMTASEQAMVGRSLTSKTFSSPRTTLPAIIAAAGERASLRFLEFFAANIRNPHTRRAYSRAVAEFLAWCDDQGVSSVAAVQPLHVAAWIELQQKESAAPTVKARLA